MSVKIKDQVDRLKVLIDISTLMGYIIDTFRKPTPSAYKVFQKVDMIQEPATMSNTQKGDLSIMLF